MQYVLGNMLNGGGINPDGLSLDLQFAADKTFSKPSSLAAGETAITSRRGPSATFLRSTAATEVGPDGLIRYSPENLLTQSQALASFGITFGASVPVSNTEIAPDGTQTAERLVENENNEEHGIFQNQTTSGVVSFSVYLKQSGRRYAVLRKDSSGATNATFDLQDGVVSQAMNSTASIQNVGNGWFRCVMTSSAIGLVVIKPANIATGGGNSAYQGDGSSGIIVWGAQLERHPTARAYIPTTTAAVYAPRFDHDPVTLACKGLLIEEGRTNLAVYSDQFNDTSWVKTNSTITANASVAPDGTTTADKLRVNTTLGQHNVNRLSIGASGITTMSIFAKAGELSWLALTDNQAFGAWFDLTNGVAGSSIGTIISKSIASFGNGWYRCTVSFTPNSSFSGLAAIATNANNVLDFTGANTTDGIFIWGAQLEAGSFPTSYIPTTTAPLTRSADVCSITGGDFTSFWNRFAGTCIIGVGSSLGSGPRFISNSLSARTLEIYGTTNIDFFEASGANEVRIVSPATYPIKLGLAYAINDYQSAYNGLLGGSDTNTGGTIPNATELHVGTLGGTSSRLTGHIQFIRYYKKRLPNAKLAQLTV